VLQPVDEDVQAGGEPLVAVVEQTCSPRATRAGKRSGGSERKNSCSWVLIAASRTRCSLTAVGAADREAGGVVDQEHEGQAGLVVAEPGSLQRCRERLGQGEGVRPQRVAGALKLLCVVKPRGGSRRRAGRSIRGV
jgi:hypothetical protein